MIMRKAIGFPPLDLRALASDFSNSGVISFEDAYGLMVGTYHPDLVSIDTVEALGLTAQIDDMIDNHIGVHPIRSLILNRIAAAIRRS